MHSVKGNISQIVWGGDFSSEAGGQQTGSIVTKRKNIKKKKGEDRISSISKLFFKNEGEIKRGGGLSLERHTPNTCLNW